MAITLNSTDAQTLRRFIPIASLPERQFEDICSVVAVEEGQKDSVLFKQGDKKKEFVYLLSGSIELRAGGVEMETIEAGSSSGRFALAHQIPRKVSAIAKGKVRYIRVDTALLTIPEQNSDEQSNYEVSDIPEEDSEDWMTTLLQSPVFQRLPAANLQKVMMELEEVSLQAGEVLFNQDDPGDYYYIIKKGACALTRKPSKNAKEFKLAELKSCDAFGEDALISDGTRNLTATMSCDGVMLRLHKYKFLNLVKGPVIKYVDYNTAKENLGNRCALVDVRPPEEFEKEHVKGSKNIPFFSIRMHLNSLSRNEQQIIVCQDGNTSEAAAFLLIRFGFDAVVLRDGFAKIPDIDREGTDNNLEGKTSTTSGSSSTLTEAIPTKRDGEKKDIGAAYTNLKDLPANTDALDQLKEQLRAAEARGTDFQQTADLLEKEKETSIRRQAEMEKNVADLRARYSAVNENSTENRKAMDVLRSDLVNATSERDRLHADFKAQTVEFKQIKNAEQELTDELATAKRHNAALETKLQENENQIKNQEAELSAMREQTERLEQLANDNFAAQSAQPRELAQINILSNELVELRQTNDTISKEKLRFQEQSETLSAQVDELKSVVQALLNQEDTQDYIEEMHALKTELEMVRIQADSDVKTMQAELEKEKQQTAELKSLLQKPTPVNPALKPTDGDVFAMLGDAATASDPEIDDNVSPKKKKLFLWG